LEASVLFLGLVDELLATGAAEEEGRAEDPPPTLAEEGAPVLFLSFLDGILGLGPGDGEEGTEGPLSTSSEESPEMARLRGSDARDISVSTGVAILPILSLTLLFSLPIILSFILLLLFMLIWETLHNSPPGGAPPGPQFAIID